jgi:hypothetical protein
MDLATFDFFDTLQFRTAMLAVGRSTVRNQGGPGIVAACRRYLRSLDLNEFRVDTEEEFREVREAHALALKQRFPAGAKTNWGAARKVMNIFLRDVLYSRPLCNEYKLSRLEPWLELPLDRDAYRGVCRDSGGELKVTQWPRIKRLTPEFSDKVQQIAWRVAKAAKTQRVHLDVKYWRKGQLDDLAASTPAGD